MKDDNQLILENEYGCPVWKGKDSYTPITKMDDTYIINCWRLCWRRIFYHGRYAIGTPTDNGHKRLTYMALEAWTTNVNELATSLYWENVLHDEMIRRNIDGDQKVPENTQSAIIVTLDFDYSSEYREVEDYDDWGWDQYDFH